MKLLRKQPGLPFLMALGLLLILSASFLAVQLWSDGSVRRGAAQALEAPVMPKALELGKKNGKAPGKSPVKAAPKIVKNDPETDPETVEKNIEMDDQQEENFTEDTSSDLPDEKPVIEEKKPAKAVEKKPVAAAPAVENTVKPVVDSPVEKAEPVEAAKEAAQEQKKSEVIKEEKKPVREVKKAKPVKAAKVSKKAREVEEDSGVVPPEWDWFSTPLKIELKQGQVEIVPAVTPVDLKLVAVAAKTADVEAPVVVEDVKKLDVESQKVTQVSAAASEKPFAKALERMAKIRKIREAREKKAVARKDHQITVVDEVSPSMKKLGETLRKLSEKLDRAPGAAVEKVSEASASVVEPSAGATFEEAPPVKATGGSEDIESGDVNSQLKPYYSGSGSSFSNRVNDLIRRGAWLRD